MRRHLLAFIAAAAALTATQASANKLLGTWVLVGNNCSITDMAFTAATATKHNHVPGLSPMTISGPVTYNDRDPRVTYVIASDGYGQTNGYTWIDANHIRFNSTNVDGSFCEYVRH